MMSQTILFADDDVLTQWVMTEALTECGFDVIGACRGAEALELLADGTEFDMLIVDVDLPDGVSGAGVGQVWRRAMPGRPVLYIGENRPRQTQRLERGEAFLAKPFGPERLLEAIDQTLMEVATETQAPTHARHHSVQVH